MISAKRTKIIATIGPASQNPEILKKLIMHGLNTVRLNFSHGTHDNHQLTVNNIRKLSKELNQPVGILADLSGPKIRIGKLPEEPFLLNEKKSIILTSQIDSHGKISFTFPDLLKYVKKGDSLLLDDGKMKLRIEKVSGSDIHCKVIHGGKLYSNKGITVISESISIPSLTKKDILDLKLAIELKVDFLALSFVRSKEDILELKKKIKQHKAAIPVIAKIEKPQAVDNLDSILSVSDGIMIARGDLGVEIPLQNVPIVQKEIIQKCNIAGKPVITATQMLESMIHEIRPTRAEAADIANAILDGTDALMLSAETAIGKYPVECVKVMSEIAVQADNTLCKQNISMANTTFTDAGKNQKEKSKSMINENRLVAEGVSHSVARLAEYLHIPVIVTITSSGSTARMIARYRPKALILVITSDKKTLTRMQITWGVIPKLISSVKHTDKLIKQASQIVKKNKMAQSGDLILITAGIPINTPGITNFIRISKL